MVEVTLTFEAHPEQVPFFLALYRVLTRPQDTDDRNGPAIEADRDKLLASLPLAVTELAIRVEAVLKEYPTRYGPAARALLEHLAGTTLPLPPSTANPDPQKELRERLTELFPEKKGPLLARTKKTLLRAIKYADDLDAPNAFLCDRGQAGGRFLGFDEWATQVVSGEIPLDTLLAIHGFGIGSYRCLIERLEHWSASHSEEADMAQDRRTA